MSTSCLEKGDKLILGAKAVSIGLKVFVISLKIFGLGSLQYSTNRTVYKPKYTREDIFRYFLKF